MYVYHLASSMDMEWGFSQGGLMVSSCRHNLKGASVQAGVVLSLWHEIPGLIPEKALIKMFNDKSIWKKVSSIMDSEIIVVDN